MNFYKYWQSVIRNYQDYGLTTTIAKLVSYMVKPIYENRTYRVYCIELDHHDLAPISKNDRFIFKLIRPADDEIIQKVESMAEWFRGAIEAKLRSNHILMVAMDDDIVAGFNLVAIGKAEIPLLQWAKDLPDDEAWSEQITVDKPYRRKGLGSAIRHHMFKELKNSGIKRLCGGALISNQASLKLSRRAGFTEVEDIQFIKILWHKQWRHHEVNT